MTAQLFEVKNKFSEFVALAHSGEVVEVCKYGKPMVVIVNSEDYAKSNNTRAKIFRKRLEMWRKEFGAGGETGLSDGDVEMFESGRKSDFGYRKNDFEGGEF